MPVVFLGHGSPMNAIEDNSFHRAWAELGARLPRPKAVLCVSAHWETQGVGVTAMERPRTIHDFRGFPQALFDVRYSAPGDPALAQRIAELLTVYRPVLDTSWGLDHGSWGVLIAMYPQADVPVVQLSLDMTKPASYHYEVGQALKPLRDEGVLILGSGNIVHNLRLFDWRTPQQLDWAVRFDATVKQRIAAAAHQDLIAFERLGDDATLAINSGEHYLPLLYVLGASDAGEPVSFINETVLSAISMTSLVVGGSDHAS
ncbi:MAG: 4,5-DOPA dioxygenase extradiol [Alphaproteobacteria bacterium]|nr:4,5-DOPA dioxygenase extradiol [Alphaproteobacteria bacterium]